MSKSTPQTCAVPLCHRPVRSRGWCKAHYNRWWSTGDVRADQPFGARPRARCSVQCPDGQCKRWVKSKGLCNAHYERLRKTGDVQAERPLRELIPSGPCSVPLCPQPERSNGYCSPHYRRLALLGGLLEDKPLTEEELNNAGLSVTRQGYLMDTKRDMTLHRIVMEEILQRPLLPNENVHHKNGLRWDTSPSNLELWTEMQPTGARVKDLLAWAREIIERYGPEEHLL